MTDRLAAFRAGYARSDVVHVNNAGIAPLCLPGQKAIAWAAEQNVQGGTLGFDPVWARYNALRDSIGRLVGAPGADVSYTQTCAAAISQAALGLPLAAGETVVRWDQEYGSNAYPWHRAAERANATVVQVPSDDWQVNTARLCEAIDERTRICAVSWVQFSTGSMTDLRQVSARCREVGAWLVVDAIQGLGVIPFDMRALGVDVVCGGSHKWLTGPVGHGFLVMGQSLREQVTPLTYGAVTFGYPGEEVHVDRPARADAKRFEPGSPLFLGALGTGAAVDHLLEAGIETLHTEALRLADRLIEGVQARGARVLSATTGVLRSPIVTFVPGGPVKVLSDELTRRKIAHAPERAGGIRISPHAFNTDDDIDAVLAAYDAVSA